MDSNPYIQQTPSVDVHIAIAREASSGVVGRRRASAHVRASVRDIFVCATCGFAVDANRESRVV
jgi:hypothetical protein